MNCEGTDILLAAYGICARVARHVVLDPPKALRGRLALFRPITLWPYPYEELKGLLDGLHSVVTLEMNAGQMVEDVRLTVQGRCPVEFLGWPGEGIPTVGEIADQLVSLFD